MTRHELIAALALALQDAQEAEDEHRSARLASTLRQEVYLLTVTIPGAHDYPPALTMMNGVIDREHLTGLLGEHAKN